MPTLSFYNEGAYNDGIYNLTNSGTQAAITLDGRTQYLGRSDVNSLGIANTWTLGFWSKPFANKEHATFFSTASSSDENRIDVLTTPIPAETNILGKRNAELRVMIKDADGATIKHYTWPDWYQDEVWTHTFLQWDGTDLDAYKDGLITATGIAFVNASGSMSDVPDRKVFYGAAAGGVFATFSGVVGHFGMWDSILAPGELETVVSGAFNIDLTTSSGGYTSSASLQHWWKPGFDQNNIGEDFGGSLNLNKLLNIDETNITTDIPTL
jgi:hypothetical protein